MGKKRFKFGRNENTETERRKKTLESNVRIAFRKIAF